VASVLRIFSALFPAAGRRLPKAVLIAFAGTLQHRQTEKSTCLAASSPVHRAGVRRVAALAFFATHGAHRRAAGYTRLPRFSWQYTVLR
jgi:hypothetical protein